MAINHKFPKDPQGMHGIRLCVNGNFDDPFTFQDFSVRERWISRGIEASKDKSLLALLLFCERFAGAVEQQIYSLNAEKSGERIVLATYLGQDIAELGLQCRPSLDEVKSQLSGIWQFDSYLDDAIKTVPSSPVHVFPTVKASMN